MARSSQKDREEEDRRSHRLSRPHAALPTGTTASLTHSLTHSEPRRYTYTQHPSQPPENNTEEEDDIFPSYIRLVHTARSLVQRAHPRKSGLHMLLLLVQASPILHPTRISPRATRSHETGQNRYLPIVYDKYPKKAKKETKTNKYRNYA